MDIFITNQGMETAQEFLQDQFKTDQSVYEVIRIIDGIALFLEDHYSRLQKSMAIAKLDLDIDLRQFGESINELIHASQIREGNVRFVYSVSAELRRWTFSFIPHNYPKTEEYLNGVVVDLLNAERQNPNAKVIQPTIRDKANQLISEQKIYEILLVDRDGKITEGSRSNVFFVKDGIFYTAPENMILVGITRQKVLACLNELGYPIVEEAVKASEIDGFDAAFLTGTSPKILPIRDIGSTQYLTTYSELKNLMDRYNKLIDEYIRTKKKA